ncbi:MAG: MFS transporter [Bacteroidota bacterium]
MKPTIVAIAVTLAVQTLTAMAMIAPSVLAPVAARDLGLAPQSIGFFASLTYLGAMLSGLATGRFTARFGPLAVCQAAVVLAGAGLLLGYLAVAAVVPVAALVIGFAYGVVNPVSSHILARRTPPRMMALVFSIKQTGVPAGGAIAGIVVPPLALALGWAGALPVLAAVCIAAAFLLMPAGTTLAEKRAPPAGPGGSLRGVFAGLGRPIGLALSSGALRELSYASFGYAAVQLVFITYFVSYLALELGYSLVTAGLVYACAHGAGIVGRIAWGAVADRWLAPRTTLAVLGLVSALCALLVAAFSPAWPLAAVTAVGMLFGASAVGWNGVFLAQVARVAPTGQVSSATGGTQFFTFAGALSGPPLFAAAVWATASYAWAFALFAIPSAAVALRLLARR